MASASASVNWMPLVEILGRLVLPLLLRWLNTASRRASSPNNTFIFVVVEALYCCLFVNWFALGKPNGWMDSFENQSTVLCLPIVAGTKRRSVLCVQRGWKTVIPNTYLISLSTLDTAMNNKRQRVVYCTVGKGWCDAIFATPMRSTRATVLPS